ncbi:hypothetical protein REC12_23265 [Desulfosporosinus sp. PR]|nr:hypothetical protein [Desulfosporosinus sp. PR]
MLILLEIAPWCSGLAAESLGGYATWLQNGWSSYLRPELVHQTGVYIN